MTEVTIVNNRAYEIANAVFFTFFAIVFFFLGMIFVLPHMVTVSTNATGLAAMLASGLLSNVTTSPIGTMLILLFTLATAGYFTNLSVNNFLGQPMKVTAENSS